MARPIDLDQLMKYPLRRGSEHCDEKNADPRFLAGVESILEWAQTLPTLTPPNEPLTLEQLREMDVEKVWRGEWVGVPSMGVYDTVCSKCGYCPGIRFWSSDFCPHCGTPMTDEAVEMVMKRMEALHEKT